jgi:hypothetical protein
VCGLFCMYVLLFTYCFCEFSRFDEDVVRAFPVSVNKKYVASSKLETDFHPMFARVSCWRFFVVFALVVECYCRLDCPFFGCQHSSQHKI